MKVFITGICGFVGSAIAEQILDSVPGAQVSGIDNLARPGSEINRRRLDRMGARFYHGDIRLASDWESIPAHDWIVDAAANPSVLAGLPGQGTSRQLFENNLGALINVLEYCRAHRSGLLLLSSSRVYSIKALEALPLRVERSGYVLDPGFSPMPGLSGQGIGPDFSTTAPISMYGATKLASEILALDYGLAFGFPVWITRCGVLSGAGQFGTAAQGLFAYWINAHLRKQPLRYIGFDGSGYQSRDLFHPKDLVRLLLAQIQCSRNDGRRIYTAGGGPENAYSLAQLTDWCDSRFVPHAPTRDPAPRAFDIPWIAMDNSAAQMDFGWRPQIRGSEILEEIALHAEANPHWLGLSRA